MAELFADLPEALQNSVEIARRCNLTVELGKSRLPDFPTPPASRWRPSSPANRMPAWKSAGMELLYPDAAEREKQRPTYVERLDFEIATIIRWVSPATS
jgi:DNA polymerase-3 subunit alpha